MKKYRIFDSTNTYIRTFDSWLAAYEYCIAKGRMDWQIK